MIRAPLAASLLLLPALAAAEAAFVWEIEGGKAPMAVCGSIHVLPPDAHPLPPPFQSAYDRAEVVVFELLMDEMFQPAALRAVQEAMVRPAGSPDSLSPELRQRLDGVLTERGLPPAAFQNFKSWAVVQQLALFELQKHGISPAYGVDLHYTNLAKRDGKARIGLETLQEQLAFLQAMDASGGERLLAESLDKLPRIKEDFDRLATAWRTGDREALASQMNEFFQSGPDLDETLLRSRNRAWIPKLEELLQSGRPSMVIVGAGHLCGPENVIELLEARGYRASRP